MYSEICIPEEAPIFNTKDNGLVPPQNILGETLTVGNYLADRGLPVLFLFSSDLYFSCFCVLQEMTKI